MFAKPETFKEGRKALTGGRWYWKEDGERWLLTMTGLPIHPSSISTSVCCYHPHENHTSWILSGCLSKSLLPSLHEQSCPLNTAKLIGPNLWSSLPSRTDVRGFSFPLWSASPPGVSPVVHLLDFSYLDRTHITPHQSSAWTIYWAHFWFVVVVATVLIVICGSQVWRF